MPARVSNLAGCSGRFPQLADGGGVTTRGSEAMTALVMEQVEGEGALLHAFHEGAEGLVRALEAVYL